MSDTEKVTIPEPHADVIEAMRVHAENAPESLRIHILAALDAYAASSAWEMDAMELYR